MCYGKSRKQTDCQGQTGYAVKRLDNVVDGVIRHVFDNMRSIPKTEVVASGLTALQQELDVKYRIAQRDYTKAAADLNGLKTEVIKAIRSESKFSPDLLSELISKAENEITELERVRNNTKQDMDLCKLRIEELQADYEEVISWTELYDAADLAAKKMVVANLVNRIEVGTDYQIHIDLNIDLEHFNINLDICSHRKKETA